MPRDQLEFRLVSQCNNRLRIFAQVHAITGEHGALSAALEQLLSETFLQISKLTQRCRLRHMQRLGRVRR